MAKSKADTSAKTPKTVKVSTIMYAVGIIVSLAVGFYAGTYATNHYNNTVKAQAVQLTKELKADQ